ncbi:uncharacterized protein HaLaN_16345 [Haematococcus lacustris]|uniref:Uncharacterized protein n=1 Tax=Haematococcus lacustris TaxID=44745 RepID=A0A699Z9U9_HAELA|nr:uncharacterized protein HaLaN_16345 [Haematococcus lacustris]
MAACVAAAQQPLLQLDRVVLARTGTLLMTWRDETGAVTGLRQALRRTFPGACAKQANIIHTSLLRILGPAQLPRETIAAIVALCDKLTAKLAHHTQLAPSALWFIDETEFSTVVGDKQLLRVPA